MSNATSQADSHINAVNGATISGFGNSAGLGFGTILLIAGVAIFAWWFLKGRKS